MTALALGGRRICAGERRHRALASGLVGGLRIALGLAAHTLEASLAVAWFLSLGEAHELLLLHVLLCLAYLAASLALTGTDEPVVWDRAALLFLLGPLAAIGTVAALAPGGAATAPDVLDRGREGGDGTSELSIAEALYNEVKAGRRARREPSACASLEAALASGDLARQQRAIALISRCYEPEMLAGLEAARASPTPAVRVQAAAVFAKLRERAAAEAKALLATAEEAGGTLPARAVPLFVERCRSVVRSGFLAEDVAKRLQALAGQDAAPAVCARQRQETRS